MWFERLTKRVSFFLNREGLSLELYGDRPRVRIMYLAGVRGDPQGDIEINPINGTGRLFGNTGNGVISPPGNINTLAQRDIDLTDSMFSFGDITLKVTVPNTIGLPWAPNFVRLSVDGDNIQVVPEPITTIFGSALAIGFGALLKKEHSRIQKKKNQEDSA